MVTLEMLQRNAKTGLIRICTCVVISVNKKEEEISAFNFAMYVWVSNIPAYILAKSHKNMTMLHNNIYVIVYYICIYDILYITAELSQR